MDKGIVRREDLFIITKLWLKDAGEESAERAFNESLERLQTDYIDLYLIHQPYNDYYGAWRTLEKICQRGRTRAIGVSNFSPERLMDLCLNSEIPPMVNQIETHPFYHQKEALRTMHELGGGSLRHGRRSVRGLRTFLQIRHWRRSGKNTGRVRRRQRFAGILTAR